MTTTIVVRVPSSIFKYHTYLQDFIEHMIEKLDKNSHKDTPDRDTLQGIMDKLIAEVVEFETQVSSDKFNENSLMELCDQANFAFLAYVVLRNEGVKHVERTRRSAEHDKKMVDS